MATHLGLIPTVVAIIWSMFSEIPRCWPWFFSIIIRFVVTPGWNVVDTTTINANGIAATCFVGYTALFYSMRPSSAFFAENILTAILSEVICTSTGSASYLRPTCVLLGAGTRLCLVPSIRTFDWSSFGLPFHCFYLFCGSSERIYSFYLTSVIGRAWYI